VESAVTRGRGTDEAVTRVVTFTGSAFRPPKEAIPVLVFGANAVSLETTTAPPTPDAPSVSIDGWCQGAVLTIGAGRVAIFGEAAMFSAQLAGPNRIPVGMNAPGAEQNYQLLLNLMRWLARTEDASDSTPRKTSSSSEREYKNSLDTCPMSPLFKIYAIHYCRRITPHSELIAGPYYANIHYKNIGNTNAPGFIVGYRRYVWKTFHVDYQLMPQWDHYYERNERKRYPLGFDLWNEFRFGYVWDFRLGSAPLFLNFQWPFGFALYSDGSAKPESFKKRAEDKPFFYYPPMFFAGVRF
jgi:hypothetical protein